MSYWLIFLGIVLLILLVLLIGYGMFWRKLNRQQQENLENLHHEFMELNGKNSLLNRQMNELTLLNQWLHVRNAQWNEMLNEQEPAGSRRVGSLYQSGQAITTLVNCVDFILDQH